MLNIEELIEKAKNGIDITAALRAKSIDVPSWAELEKEYNPKKHPVMDTKNYPDIIKYKQVEVLGEYNEDGTPKVENVATGEVEKVSRIVYDLQNLAVKRTSELCFGIPVKRVYRPETDFQKDVARYIENIYKRNRISTVNIERGTKLFASCEFFTMWYAVEEDNNIYGFNSKLKLRCVTYSPMQGDDLYPLFDETGDMVAMSIAYKRKVENTDVSYFDTYTATTHIRWSSENDEGFGVPELIEDIKILKIPGIYCYRPAPVWENTSGLVYEMEWAMSRNGNYLRKNSRPILAAMVSEELQFNQSPSTDSAFRDIVQYPQGSTLQYVTWPQAIDNLKFYVNELRQSFFTQLQLPDWSYENMKTTPMSGEARKQLFIDCQLKVQDESGRLIEAFDREVNVIKAFVKLMIPGHDEEIDSLPVENIITPFTITDTKDKINELMTKNGGKALCSQRESIEELGESDNVDETLRLIAEEKVVDAFNLSE